MPTLGGDTWWQPSSYGHRTVGTAVKSRADPRVVVHPMEVGSSFGARSDRERSADSF